VLLMEQFNGAGGVNGAPIAGSTLRSDRRGKDCG